MAVSEADLEALDVAVERAVGAGTSAALPVIGFGEISTVIAWPPDRPLIAAKRLPIFQGLEEVTIYRAAVEDYVRRLAARGVRTVDTAVWAGGALSCGRRAFLIQPLVDTARLLSARLAELEEGDPLATRSLGAIVELVASAVDAVVGLDAQVSNWALDDSDGLLYLDVSTPFVRGADGSDALDVSWLSSVYPAALRPVIRRWVAPRLIAAYHEPRSVLVDLGANLHREGLARHVDALTTAAAQHGFDIESEGLRRYFAANTRTWRVLRGLRRVDAAWQRRIRRRPYPFLLPEDCS